MSLEKHEKELVHGSLKPLQENCAKELMYSNMKDVLTLVETFREVDKVIETSSNLTFVLKSLEAYLEEFLSKSKKFLTGSQFAQICDHIAFAKQNNLHQFNEKLL